MTSNSSGINKRTVLTRRFHYGTKLFEKEDQLGSLPQSKQAPPGHDVSDMTRRKRQKEMKQKAKIQEQGVKLREYFQKNKKVYELIHKIYLLKKSIEPVVNDLIENAINKAKGMDKTKRKDYSPKIMAEKQGRKRSDDIPQVYDKSSVGNKYHENTGAQPRKGGNDNPYMNDRSSVDNKFQEYTSAQPRNSDPLEPSYVPQTESTQPPKQNGGQINEVFLSETLNRLTDILQGPLRESVKQNPDIIERMTYVCESLSRNLDALILKYPHLQALTSISHGAVTIHRSILVDPQRTRDVPGTSGFNG